MKKINVGIVGCGHIGKIHALAFSKTPNAVLAAVCDANKERAKALADKHNIKWYVSYSKMLERGDIDAISVCTPHVFHTEHCFLAAEAFKHVLCEKPLAETLEKCDKIIATTKEAGVNLMVAHNHRFYDANVMTKKFLKEKAIGNLIMARDSVLDYLPYTNWIMSKEMGGGAFMFNVIHIIDRLRWWLDSEVDSVFGKIGTYVWNGDAEDNGAAFLTFRNGVYSVIQASMSSQIKNIITELLGTEGILQVNTWRGVKLAKRKKWKTLYEVENWKNKDRVQGFVNQAAEFVNSILEDRKPAITGEEGRRNVEVVLALYESSKLDNPVKLPLK